MGGKPSFGSGEMGGDGMGSGQMMGNVAWRRADNACTAWRGGFSCMEGRLFVPAWLEGKLGKWGHGKVWGHVGPWGRDDAAAQYGAGHDATGAGNDDAAQVIWAVEEEGDGLWRARHGRHGFCGAGGCKTTVRWPTNSADLQGKRRTRSLPHFCRVQRACRLTAAQLCLLFFVVITIKSTPRRVSAAPPIFTNISSNFSSIPPPESMCAPYPVQGIHKAEDLYAIKL